MSKIDVYFAKKLRQKKGKKLLILSIEILVQEIH